MDECTDTHMLYHPYRSSVLAHRSTYKDTRALSLPAEGVMEYVQCVVCEKNPKARCDFAGNAFQPGNSVCLRLLTATVRFHHAWPGTHEQPPDEELWQLSPGHGRSQWEFDCGECDSDLVLLR